MGHGQSLPALVGAWFFGKIRLDQGPMSMRYPVSNPAGPSGLCQVCASMRFNLTPMQGKSLGG